MDFFPIIYNWMLEKCSLFSLYQYSKKKNHYSYLLPSIDIYFFNT